MVVAVVIKHGLIRFSPASTIDALISFLVSGEFLSKVCVKYVAITTPSSVAIPKSAINPTQTATLKLMACIWNKSRRFSPKKLKFKNQS